jgi:hypothetical protein
MKTPLPFLLYLTSAGLFGFTGWTVYEMLPGLLQRKASEAASQKGGKDATTLVAKGLGQIPDSPVWNYGSTTSSWWAEFKAANFLGKPPPPPPKGPEEVVKPPEVTRNTRPLEEIVEIVALTYDGEHKGRGGNTHVIVRYRDQGVQPPEWYRRENMSSPGGPAGPVAAMRDTVAPRGGTPPTTVRPPANPPRATTPLPVSSSVGREILQKLWVQDEGDPRRQSSLWPPFGDIKLVRVSPDAQAAYFVRSQPAEAGKDPVEPQEEELIKTAMNLSQDVLRELRRLQGRSDSPTAARTTAPAPTNSWVEVEETMRSGNTFNVGRKDEKALRENSDELLERFNFDVWKSSSASGRRGLIVRDIGDAKLASKFGIVQGDVLLEVNGHPVSNKAAAIQFGKGEYKKGVRTFVTKWYSNGAEVERVYQAPDK